MVTTLQVPDEANEPPEPPPHSTAASITVPNHPGEQLSHSSGLHQNGGPVGSFEATPEARTPSQAVSVPPSTSQEAINAGTISYDYATAGQAPQSSVQSKYSPAGTTVVSTGNNSTVAKAGQFTGDNAHYFAPTEVASYLGVDLKNGLATKVAEERLARDGPNKLEGDEGIGIWRVLVRQVSNSLTLVS